MPSSLVASRHPHRVMKFGCNLSLVHPDHFLEIAPIVEEYDFDNLLLGRSRRASGRDRGALPLRRKRGAHVGPLRALAGRLGRHRYDGCRDPANSLHAERLRPAHAGPVQRGQGAGNSCARMSGTPSGVWGSDWVGCTMSSRSSANPFRARGARADEMIEVMKALWTGELVEHHGRFFDFAPLSMSPAVEDPKFRSSLAGPRSPRSAAWRG